MAQQNKKILSGSWAGTLLFPALLLFLTFTLQVVPAAAAPAETAVSANRCSIPAEIETGIGTLRFAAGRPDAASTQKLYDQLNLNRATEVFLNNLPAVSTEAIRRALIRLGATRAHQVIITEELANASVEWLTANTETVYAMAFLDLKRDGATVVEIPPGCGPGLLDDAWMRWVIDFGPIGLDRGRGGTYLILPPDYKGDLAPAPGGTKVTINIAGREKEVFAVKSPSFRNWLGLRGFLVKSRPEAAVRLFKQGLKIYPLKTAGQPPAMQFIDFSRQPSNTVFPADAGYFSMLNEVIQYEPVNVIDPETRGRIAAIGIEKGTPFQADESRRKLYTEAAKLGDATGRALFYAPRNPQAYLYKDRQWFTVFLGQNYNWLKDKGRGGRNLDARILYFYCATANTPAMVLKFVGKGSQYALSARDARGRYLDGGKNYRLHIPPQAPVTHFWSVVLYDSQNRCLLNNGQDFPSKSSDRDPLLKNGDGSIDLYFGPKPPAGKKANWIKTNSGQGWFSVLRLYGPLEPWFDKSWKPGDFEQLQ
jgi:hypothetical protein